MSETASKRKSATEENDEYSSEEEELVYVTFDTVLDSEFMQPDIGFKLIGLDEDQPILQLGSQVYSGVWKDTVGTAVFLEEDPTAANGDPVFTKNPSKMLRMHSKTRKNLAMSRVFINPKDQTGASVINEDNPDDQPNASHMDQGIDYSVREDQGEFIEEEAGCSYSERNDDYEPIEGEGYLEEESEQLDNGRCIAMDLDSACNQYEDLPGPATDDQPSCSYGPYVIKTERYP